MSAEACEQLPVRKKIHIAVVGPSAAGKSCLIRRFMTDEFDKHDEKAVVDYYRQAILDRREFMIQVSDTEGRPTFNCMREQYILHAHAFLLVFDVMSQESFQELHECVQQIIRIKGTRHVPMALVGTKADLWQTRMLNADVTVDEYEAVRKADELGVPYYETSAKNGWYVQDVFEDLCRQIIWQDLRQHRKPKLEERKRNRSSMCSACVIL